jgi:hypothetical protein
MPTVVAAEPPASTRSGSEPIAGPPPLPPGLVEVCNRSCERMRAHCAETAAESCRMNCTQYAHPPVGCEGLARAALECANGAEDYTCVNIAPESCAAKFRRVVACAKGEPDPGEPADPTRVPDSWQRFEAHGFAVPMPADVAQGEEGGDPLVTSAQGGVTYSVRVTAAPTAQPTQQNLVRVTLGLLGRCGRKLKLYSMVERSDKVSIRFDSACPDASQWRGMLVIAGERMYVLRVAGPAGFREPIDPFIYNFETR